MSRPPFHELNASLWAAYDRWLAARDARVLVAETETYLRDQTGPPDAQERPKNRRDGAGGTRDAGDDARPAETANDEGDTA